MSETRKLGIDVLGTVPWGTHICYFYNTKQDLIDTLVPYFQAGLKNNEFCIWVTSKSLNKKEAEEAMREAVPDFSQYLSSQQMEIIPHTDWYLKDGAFNREKVINGWIEKLRGALASGHDGVRVTGDTSWLKRKDWSKFIDYEKEVNDTISKYHLLALCTYPLHKYGASEIIDAERNHQYNLVKHKGDFALIGGSEFRQAGANLWGSEGILDIASQITSDMVYERDLQTGIATFYGDIDAHLGYELGEYPRTMEGWREHVHPEDLARIENRSLDQLWPGVPHSIEYRMRKKDGTYMTWLDKVIVIRDEETGKPSKIIGAATDVTELKQAEESLKKARVEAQKYLDIAGVILIVINLEGEVTFINRKGCEILGYTEQEIIGKNWFDNFIPPRVKSEVLSVSNNLFSGEVESASYYENSVLTKSGEERIIVWHNTVLRDDNDNIISHLSSGEDITDRKQAEDELKTIAKTSFDGFWISDLDGRFLEVNDSYCQMIGYTREELLKMSSKDIEAIESHEDIIRHIQKIKEQGSDHFKTRHKRKDGEIIDVEINVNYLDTGEGECFVFIRDITRQKRVEDGLQASEENYRTLVEDALVGIINVDLTGKITYVNKTILQATGYSWGELVGKNAFRLGLISDETIKVLRERMKKKLTGQPPGILEIQCKRKDGEWIWLQIRGIVLRKHNMPVGIQIIGEDITDRKREEETMREYKEKFSKVFRTSPDIVVISTLEDGKVIEVNDSYTRVTGYTREDTIGKRETDFDFWVKAEDRARLVHKQKERGKIRNLEFNFRTKSGEICTGLLSSELINIGDEPCIISIITDITERKQAEETLRKTEEKYRQLVDFSPAAVTTLNMKGVITSCNPYIHFHGGYSEEELIGKHFTEIASVHPEDIPKFRRMFQDILSGKVIKPFVAKYTRKDGTPGWIETHISLLEKGGKNQGIQLFQKDITELKRIQEERRKILRAASGRPLTQLQKRFIKEGLTDLSESAGIRLIFNLCRYCPACDKRIGNCIRHYKSVRALLSASVEELKQAGVCSRGLFTVKLFRELPAEVLKQKIIERTIYKSSKEIFDYLYYVMRDLKQEVFKVIYLNNRSQIIDTVDLFEGTTDSIPIRPREIVESAIAHSAAGLIFVHNHPTGDPTPSKTDKQLTRDLVFVGAILQMKILDHIIIGENSYFSFADDGLIQKYQDNFLNLKIRGVLASMPLYQHPNNLPRGLHLQHKANTLSNIIGHLIHK
jgi:DNA repair protein RadC